MRILFDHCVPRPLRREFAGHIIETAAQNGWQELSNGKLLDAVQDAGFDVFVTVDQNLQHQQNLSGRTLRLLILVAENNLTDTLAVLVPLALIELVAMRPGELRVITLPTSQGQP
jgi:predicted nuclease of predicted toxin-antitoxin system